MKFVGSSGAAASVAILSVVTILFVGSVTGSVCGNNKRLNTKLFCYYGKSTDVDGCRCTHVILPADADVKIIDSLRQRINDVKILITVNRFNEGLIKTLKSTKIDGLEINLKKLDSKNDISDFISTVRTKIGTDLYLAVSVPPKAELLAKYYDMKALTKYVDVFLLQTSFLGASQNVTFHPSRLSGLWDLQNTDSVVDLVSGLGAPLSKLAITAPVQAYQFKLQDAKHTAIGSPALEVRSINRDELCEKMGTSGMNWTLERDQDQAGPYIFREKEWIAFEDSTSIDIKAKYARVRGLAGLALKDLSQDGGSKCGSLLEAAYTGLSRQSRAPRGAVLQSLEREILEPTHRPLDTVQISPYRISRVVDIEGNVHDIREDTRTEFECSRQGYFVHPRSCGRFYRCVKFDQLSDEFSVFEFDCPAGLAFDSRYEVCVWPGSLPHASACSGSSEIAPVPRERFVCPGRTGYYADPENCRWFFACLDHGKSPLSAYEFRCPFGLVFDEERLLCEWPWLVPKCGSGGAVLGFEAGQVDFYGGLSIGGGAVLESYDGLGSLGAVALGGLSGTITETPAKVYSSVGLGIATGNVYANEHDSLHFSQHQQEALNLRKHQEESLLKNSFGSGNIDIRYEAADGAAAISANSGLDLNAGKASVEYHGNAGHSNVYSGIALGEVASVQKGYSAVATGLDLGLDVSKSSVEINNGAAYAAVPTASAVPVTVSNSEIHFGTAYDGHVVANVPELQYKIPASIAYANLSSSIGYQYKRPSVAFVQQPAVSVGYAYEKPLATPVNTVVSGGYQKASGIQSSYSYHNQEHSGYHYEKPSVAYVETASPAPIAVEVRQPIVPIAQKINTVSYARPVVQQTYVSSTARPIVQDVKIGYEYPKPSVTFVEQPAVSVQQTYVSSTPRPITPIVQDYKVGYDYPKPSFTYVQQPAVSVQQTYVASTPKPVIPVVQEVKPTVSYVQQPVVSVQQTYVAPSPKPYVQDVKIGYEYRKPSVAFVEQPAVSVQHSYVSSTPRPAVQNINIGYEIPKPALTLVKQPAVQPIYVSSTVAPPVVPVKKVEGYSYSRPVIPFVEQPAVSIQQSYVSSTPAPIASKIDINYEYQQPAFEVQKAFVVSSPRPFQKIETYDYPKPTYTVQQPVVQRQEVYTGYKYEKPVVQQVITPTIATVKQPVVTNYHYQQPVVEEVIVPKKAYVTGKTETVGYNYPKPAVAFEERPASVQHIAYQQTNAYVQPKQEVYVSTTPKYEYKQPIFVTPTQNYEQVSVAVNPFQKYVQKQSNAFVNFRSDYGVKTVTEAPVYKETYVTQSPAIAKYSFSSFDDRYTVSNPKIAVAPQNYETNFYVSSTPKSTYAPKIAVPTYETNYYVSSTPTPKVKVTPISYEPNYYIQATPKPTFASVITPVVKQQQQQTFYSYDSRLGNVGTLGSSPRPFTVPSTTAAPLVVQEYATQSPAIAKYSFGTLINKDEDYNYNYDYVSTTAKPIKQTIKYSLPAVEQKYVSTAAPTLVTVTSPRPTQAYVAPVKTVKVVKQKAPKTIVRVNDFHPFLTTKLGAQCTCSSNTLKLRKPVQPIVVEDEYAEVPVKSYRPLSEEAISVEDNYYDDGNYNYEPQRIVEVKSTTSAPQYVIKSTRPYAVRRPVKVVSTPATVAFSELPIVPAVRVKTTPVTYSYAEDEEPVVKVKATPATFAYSEAPIVPAVRVKATRIPEVFVVRKARPTAVTVVQDLDDDDDNPNERELTAAVRKGLKALKATVKEGVQEALDGHKFDRYGPGGWRSRDETLQGTADCQRAGLFRHPSQCNKFYACRWDCTKNRYTLHVFNCPVHLTFDNALGACNWPSQGPACVDDTLITSN